MPGAWCSVRQVAAYTYFDERGDEIEIRGQETHASPEHLDLLRRGFCPLQRRRAWRYDARASLRHWSLRRLARVLEPKAAATVPPGGRPTLRAHAPLRKRHAHDPSSLDRGARELYAGPAATQRVQVRRLHPSCSICIERRD